MSVTKVSSAMQDLTDDYAFSGTVTGTPTGDKRNFIIDGDFTQWPEGDITGIANDEYGPALFANLHSGGEVAHDVKQAVSNGYNFMHVDITTAETAVAAGDYLFQEYRITGSDFLGIHEQTVTIQFTHNHTKTGTYCVGLRNSANNRSYTFEYTQSVSDTEEVHTETVTLDQSGTWLLTEADVGLRLMFVVMTGSTFQTSADTWTAGNYFATSNQVAGADSASNNFKIGKVGLYLGSTAPTFKSEPISIVKNQVRYYIQSVFDRYNGAAYSDITGSNLTTTTAWFFWGLNPKMRKAPTCSYTSTATAAFKLFQHNAVRVATGNPSFSVYGVGLVRISLSYTASGTVGAANTLYSLNQGTEIYADARH